MQRAFSLLLPLTLLSCQASDEIPQAVRDFLGQERLDVLLAAEKVESFRLDSERNGQPSSDSFASYPVMSQGPDLTAEQISAFQDLVKKEESYLFHSSKRCAFLPGVGLRFVKGGQSVEVLLCFSCDEWAFRYNGQDATEDSDPVRGELLALAKALFPQDRVIHGLK